LTSDKIIPVNLSRIVKDDNEQLARNELGVLARIATLIAGKGYNIEGLSVALARMGKKVLCIRCS
jgi:hypothetical protein